MRNQVMAYGAATVSLLAACLFATGPFSASAAAADPMAPKDIQATFFDGRSFTATTPSGVSFRIVFEADGTVRREPTTAKAGAKGEGTWTLGPDGFCTTWKGAKANCFTVTKAGPNAWSVMKGPELKATWTK
ncbi:hypothetical protein [Rhodoplanes roseus]|nr:hypothetical protein [Rhodoplanes roseus]